MTALMARKRVERLWTPAFIARLGELGSLELHEDAAAWPRQQVLDCIRRSDVLLTGWGSLPIPEEIAADPGRLRYVCTITGSIRQCIPRSLLEAGITVTNWGDAPAQSIAEGAMALLLAVLKEFPAHILDKRAGKWLPATGHLQGSLAGLPVGLLGLGVIGLRFVELIRPFRPVLMAYDPYAAQWPPDVERVDSLADLCARAFALVLHAGLTPETHHVLDAALLARLPDHAIVINTARGGLIDQPALFRELERGRLRAGLDVLDTDGKDWLPLPHPAAGWPNLILTSHQVGRQIWPPPGQLPCRELAASHLTCLDNLARFRSGQPPRFQFDLNRYDRST